MKNTVKYLAILVVALTVSSALFAAQGGNSKNCSATPSTEGAIWGSGDSLSGSSSGVISPCQNSTAGKPTIERSNNQERGLGNAFGKLIHSIGASIETAIWGFAPPPAR